MIGLLMTLQISRVRIANFRNFAELDIDPFPAPAVIVGENGVGKSNFLFALRLVLDPDLPDSARQLKEEDVHEGAIGPRGFGLPGGAEVTVEVEFSGFDDDPEAVAALSGALTHLKRPMRAALTYRFAPQARLELSNDNDVVESAVEDEPDYSPNDYDFRVMKRGDPTTDAARTRRLISLRVLPALRNAEADLDRWNRSPLRTLLENLDLDPAKLAAVAKDIDDAASKLALDPEIDGLQQRLADRLHDMVGPRLPVEPTVGVTSSRPDSLVRSLRLFMDAARTRSIADASLGAANVLYLGLLMEALAVRRAASAFVVTMMGVEEPEAHLHVGVQRRLFRHLLNTEPALLLTTHSPHIAAVAPLDSLLLFRASGSTTVASTALKAKLDDREQRDITRYLDVSRAELLFSRMVLLVEGIAEVFLLPAIASAAGFDLDEYGIVILNVAGTDFAPYIRLLSEDGLNIPHAVLTDGDPLRTSKSSELGLTRAAELLTDDADRARVTGGVKRLIGFEKDGSSDSALELRRLLQDECAAKRIFVGDETLEIDLLPLMGGELVHAYGELTTGHKATANMARDISLLMGIPRTKSLLNDAAELLITDADQEDPDKATRAHRINRVLARVEKRGKGRVAQRFADHVTSLDMRERTLDLLGCLGEDVNPAIRAGKEPVDTELLRTTGSARACLRILNWASLETRERTLFSTDADGTL